MIVDCEIVFNLLTLTAVMRAPLLKQLCKHLIINNISLQIIQQTMEELVWCKKIAFFFHLFFMLIIHFDMQIEMVSVSLMRNAHYHEIEPNSVLLFDAQNNIVVQL